MHRDQDEYWEQVWYETAHMERVLAEIRAHFHDYFARFVATDRGKSPAASDLTRLAEKLGTKTQSRRRRVDPKARYQSILMSSVEEYKEKRNKYLTILDADKLEEFADDPPYFKNPVLKNQCPIIHSTLQNVTAKELDRFRQAFNLADPQDLLDAVTNIVTFAAEYCDHPPDNRIYSKLTKYEDLCFRELDSEDYGVQSVIGGGIRTHFLYRMHPDRFPYRSREAIWALWYLTEKKTLGSKYGSEFLMIDAQNNNTQNNYFYPYDLFGYYAFNIMYLLKEEARKLDLPYPDKYRFVVLDSFLSFVAREHHEEIAELKRKADDEHYS